MSHSKRNTSRAVFTSHERSLAKSNWATNSARLNRDSFLPFGSCGLCLEIARDPVSCQRGDIFCRECALANILAQKKELKRAEKARKNAELESAKVKAAEDEEDRERAIRDFELTQAGLPNGKTNGNKQPRDETEQVATGAPAIEGKKRKFELDRGELERIANEDRAKARKAIEDEKASKPSLPSFWTPSLTPDVAHDSKLLPFNKKTKQVASCPASSDDNAHSLSLQHLITIQFNEETDSATKDKRRTCPSCRKTLSNASSPAMAMKCGHVLCRNCIKQFMTPSKQAPTDTELPITCFVCDMPVTLSSDKGTASTLPSGMISLKSEGTGFSARGANTVARSSVAFQC